MALFLRFTDNDTGAITFTGNTLGLSRSDTTGVPGTRDFIGAFTTIDTSMQFGSYPPGTTDDFNLNSASAILRLPEDSEVLYAELIWAGTYAVTRGTNNYAAFINKSVSLTTPQGTTFSISPDPVTAQESHRNATDNYFRSQNVTSIIQQGGAGTYTVGGVVGNLDLGNSSANNCGWTLCVVYENSALPFRNLTLYVGDVEIASGIPELTTTLTGFATPTSGPISGRMALCAQDGDANKTGDQVLFGPDVSSLTVLQGPNNYPSNFFASQINDDNGLLDTSGTFGDRNQIAGQPGRQIVGGRQSWDITNIDVSSTLSNSQTSAVFQLRTGGDGYAVLAIGIYIDINSPRVTVDKTVDATQAVIGQVLTYTVVIENSGTVTADTAFLLDQLPNNTAFVPGSVTIGGDPAEDANPVSGIPLGALEPGSRITVTYQVRVISIPPDGVIVNEAVVNFEYQSVTGGPIYAGDITSNDVVTPVLAPSINIEKSVSPTEAEPGERVQYQIMISNTGEVDLTNVVVTDSLLGLRETIPSLPVGATTVLFDSFVIPAGAVPGEMIANTAVAASDQIGPVSDEALVTILAPTPGLEPALLIEKSVTPEFAEPGQLVEYRIEVINAGEVDLTNVVVTDAVLSLNEVIPSLPVGSSTVLFQQLRIPEGLEANSFITNVATAVSNETDSVSDEALVTILAPTPGLEPALLIEKSVTPEFAEPGQLVEYRIEVINAGEVDLTNVVVTDAVLSLNEVIPSLPVGSSTVLFQQLRIPEGLEANSFITNVATAVSNETDPVSDEALVTILAPTPGLEPALLIEKSVTPEFAEPGQLVEYRIEVINAGEVDLTNVVVTDAVLSLNEVIPSLPVGSSTVLFQQLRIPEGLEANSIITNVATAVSNETDPVSDEALVTILAPTPGLEPALLIEKSVTPEFAEPGQLVEYRIEVINAGEVDLTNVVVTDERIGLTEIIPSLPIGSNRVLVKSFQIPTGLVANSIITNIASAVSNELGPVRDEALVTILPPELPVYKLAITKTADRHTTPAGRTIHYQITVTNAGDTVLTSIRIRDELLDINRTIRSLAPNESIIVEGRYVVSSETPSRTVIVNTAWADAAETGPVSAETSVTVTESAMLDVEKSVTPRIISPGDVLTFCFEVVNITGTLSPVVLTNVILYDDLPRGTQFIEDSVMINDRPVTTVNPKQGIPLGSLAPGEAVVISFRARQLFVPAGERAENQAYVIYERADTEETDRADSNIVVIEVSEDDE